MLNPKIATQEKELIDTLDLVIQDFLKSDFVKGLSNDDIGQIIIDSSANIFARSIINVIKDKEHQMMVLEGVYKTIKHQIEQIAISEMLSEEMGLNQLVADATPLN